MKNRLCFQALFAMLLIGYSQYALGEIMAEFDFIVGTGQSVQLLKARAFEGSDTLLSPAVSSYELAFFDQQGNLISGEKLPIAFLRLHGMGSSGRSEPADSVPVTVRAPYNPRWETGKLFQDGRSIYTFKPKAMLCNRNRLCDGFENFLSCPFDCSSAAQDGWCNLASGQACDPDCLQGESGCGKTEQVKVDPNLFFDDTLGFLLILLFIGLLIVALQFRKRR